MANNVFNFKTDVRVELSIPSTGVFILGQSVLDGSDLLADGSTGTFNWVDTLADVISIETDTGVNLDAGVLTQTRPGTATIVMQTKTYDPMINPAVHTGTGIRISYRPNPDTFPAIWEIIFTGRIGSYDVAYDFNGLNTITFEAVDRTQDLINTIIPLFTTPSSPTPVQEAFYALDPYFGGGATYMASTGWAQLPQYNLTNVTAGDIMNELTDAELGFMFIDPRNEDLNFYAYNDIKAQITSGAPLYFSNTHSTAYNHYCFTDILFDSNFDSACNEIKATLKSGGTAQTIRNTDSSDLYGLIKLEKTVNLANASYLTSWLTKLSLKTELRKVKSITYPVIWDNGKVHSISQGQLLFSRANVDLNKNGVVINQDYIVTRVTQIMTPTSWDTTLELWKGV
jgi:hypothetical protein